MSDTMNTDMYTYLGDEHCLEWMCARCGMVISDKELHDDWHAKNDKAIEIKESDSDLAKGGWVLIGKQCQDGRYWHMWCLMVGEEIWFRMIPIV